MTAQEGWDDFLIKASGYEVFRKVGDMTFKGQLTAPQVKVIWDRWHKIQNNRQSKMFEDALESEWWIVEEEKPPTQDRLI